MSLLKDKTPQHFVFPIAALLTLTPWVSSGMALVLGLVLALFLDNPYGGFLKKVTHRLLAISIMGIGAGMNLDVISKVGIHGIGYTVLGISLALTIGWILGRVLKTPGDTSLLISVGTAICGGSAIAAVSPVIRAKHEDVSVALGTVFMLNAAALFLFPMVGHWLQLNQTQFGLWSALAIHDTSSVVGATMQYGAQSLEVGTTIKLARALWIVPTAVTIGLVRPRPAEDDTPRKKITVPWFILGFILAAGLVTWIPSLAPIGHSVENVAKKLMVLTLFFVGSALSRQTVMKVGAKPFLQGLILWFLMACGALAAIYYGAVA